MTRYQASIAHHSISRARLINAGDTLNAAKIAAAKEFAGEHRDYVIEIYDSRLYDGIGSQHGQIVATRKVGGKVWRKP